MNQKLFTKRALSSLVDIAIMLAIANLTKLFTPNLSAAPIIYYTMCLFRYNTTVGGVLFNVKFVDKSNSNLGTGKKVLRLMLVAILYLVISLVQLQNLYLAILLIFLLIILPMFFTRKSVSIIDFFSRTRVIEDSGYTYRKFRKENIIFFILIVVFLLSFIGYLIIAAQSCYSLFQKKSYKLVIEECQRVTKISNDYDLHYILGISYRGIKEYDKALESLEISKILGKKNLDFLIAGIYLSKKDYSEVIDIVGRDLNNINNLSLLAITYGMRSLNENNKDDLVIAYAYANIAILKYNKVKHLSKVDDKTQMDQIYKFVDSAKKLLTQKQKDKAYKIQQEIITKNAIL